MRYSALRWKEGVRTMGNNKYKILIVEDEANIRSFIKANLETSDYQVLCAETCALGIMMYASHRPDLIVLDLGLPDRDGLDLIQKVRESDTVPIIVLSARSNERDKVEALDLGANDYITRPSVTALTYSHKYTLSAMPQISDKTYDLAISFLTPHYFARERVKAKKYAAWIHTDYTALSFDRSAELAMWSGYDAICGVSEQASRSFQTVFPELSDKVQTVENILPKELIAKQAEQPQTDMPSDGAVKILSVGRFCDAKNFDNVPDICRRLMENALDVKWYLIGYGGDEPLIRQKIAEAGMQERVIILGKKDNPYPYMRACDLYVQPSRYEGKAVTVREAQLLGKPVVITNYATSASQLEDGVDGVIVPMDNAGCAAGIAALLRDPARMQQLSENCVKRDYMNSAEVEKIYALMED